MLRESGYGCLSCEVKLDNELIEDLVVQYEWCQRDTVVYRSSKPDLPHQPEIFKSNQKYTCNVHIRVNQKCDDSAVVTSDPLTVTKKGKNNQGPKGF